MLQIPEPKLKEILLVDGVVPAQQFDVAISDAQRMGSGLDHEGGVGGGDLPGPLSPGARP